MAREVIRIRNEFYIRSSSARVDVRTRVLKQGDTFAVFDRFGDIETFGTGELGLYYQDTRFLSRLTLRLGKDRPLLLSSTVREDNAVMAVDATTPDTWQDSEIVIPRGTVHVFRSKILWDKTIRAGKIPSMPFFTETAHLPKRLSRFARFRVTFTRAKIAASELAKMLGHAARARDLSQQAETLRSQFEQAFWCDELS